MQSTTTQTDLVASYWLICFAYFIFRTTDFCKADFFWLASSLGLAIMAKPTATIFSIPLIGFLVIRYAGNISALRKLNTLIRSICFSLFVSISALLLSFPYYWRNIKTFGYFLGIDNGTRVESIGLDILISNVLRNIALNLPWEYFWKFVANLHVWLLRLDVNEPKTTFFHCAFNSNLIQRLILPDEDFVANPIHLILIAGAVGIVFTFYIFRKDKCNAHVAQLSACSAFGFFLYCLLIKWQIWANRLTLPFFIMNAPFVAYFINRFMSKVARVVLIGLMVIVSVFYSLTPIHRPLIALPRKWTHYSQSDSILTLKRRDIYHSSYGKELKSAYDLFSTRVYDEGCSFIGLDIGEDDCEYPIWISLQTNGIDTFKIKHANVRNASQKALVEFPDEKICILFRKKGRFITIFSQNGSTIDPATKK